MIGRLRYLLDTNTISALAKRPDGPAARRYLKVDEYSVCTSVIVACELRFGVVRKGDTHLSRQIEIVLSPILVLPLEPPVDAHYADIRAALERAGTPIGPNDLLIAAQARALGLTLVTGNIREFSRVPGLVVENWLE